jgi:RES domain-containing protein
VVKGADDELPDNWSTLRPVERAATRRLGNAWVEWQQTPVLSVPSVIVGERNYVLNPGHPEFERISFVEPVSFQFDLRLVSREELQSADREARSEAV